MSYIYQKRRLNKEANQMQISLHFVLNISLLHVLNGPIKGKKYYKIILDNSRINFLLKLNNILHFQIAKQLRKKAINQTHLYKLNI